eukprot:PhF_6_TR2013/c0_g1_i1/m.3453
MVEKQGKNNDTNSQTSGISTAGGGRSRLLHRRIQLFPVLRSLQGTKPFSETLVAIGLFVQTFQLFASVLNQHIDWEYGISSSIVYLVEAAWIPFWDPMYFPFSDIVFFALYFVFVAGFLVYFVYFLSLLIVGSDDKSETYLSVMRTLTHFIATIAFEPLLHVLLSQTVCDNNKNVWLFPSTECWTPVHFIMTFISIVIGFMLLAVVKVFVELVFDDDPFSKHAVSRAHSKVDNLTTWYQVGRVLSYHMLLARDMHATYLFIHMFATFFMGVIYILTMPYFHPIITKLRVAAYFMTCHLFVIQFVNSRRPFSYHGTIGLGTMAFSGYIGYYLATYRISRKFQKAVWALLNDDEPIKTEPIIPAGLPTSELSFTNFKELQEDLLDADDSQNVEAEEDVQSDDSEEVLGSHFGITTPYLEHVYLDTDLELATRFLLYYRKLCDLPPNGTMLCHAARIYLKGFMMFPTSVLLRIHYSQFMLVHACKIQFAHLEVERAAGMTADLVHLYMLFKLGLRIKAMLGIRDKTHLHNFNTASRLQKEALHFMGDFWMRVMQANVDFVQLATLANDITDRRIKALSLYKRVLLGGGLDHHILERFATFCDYIMLDTLIAGECYNDAKVMAEERKRFATGRKSGNNDALQAFQQALVERFETLESKDRKGGNRTIEVLARNLNAVIVLLMIIVIANVILHLVNSTLQSAYIDKSTAMGYARTFSAYVLNPIEELISFTGATSDAGFSDILGRLSTARDTFESLHNSVTYGTNAPTSVAAQGVFADDSIVAELYSSTLTSASTAINMGLWTLGNYVVAAAQKIHTLGEQSKDVEEGRFGSSATITTEPSLVFLRSNAFRVGIHYNISMTVLGQEWTYYVDVAMFSLVGLYVLFLMIILLVYALFLMNFQKIAMSKVQTLRLFTLIPSNTLSKMCSEAQTRITQNDKSENEDEERVEMSSSSAAAAAAEEAMEEEDLPEPQVPNKKRRSFREAVQAVVATGRVLQRKLSTIEARRQSHIHKSTPMALLLQKSDEGEGAGSGSSAGVGSPLGDIPPELLNPPEDHHDEEEVKEEEKTASHINIRTSKKRGTLVRAQSGITQREVGSALFACCLAFIMVLFTGMNMTSTSAVPSQMDQMSRVIETMDTMEEVSRSILDFARRFIGTGDEFYYVQFWSLQKSQRMVMLRYDLEEFVGKEYPEIGKAFLHHDRLTQREMIAMRLCLAKYNYSIDAFPELQDITWSNTVKQDFEDLDRFRGGLRLNQPMYTTRDADLSLSPTAQYNLAVGLMAADDMITTLFAWSKQLGIARNKYISSQRDLYESHSTSTFALNMVCLIFACLGVLALPLAPTTGKGRIALAVFLCAAIGLFGYTSYEIQSSRDQITMITDVASLKNGGIAAVRNLTRMAQTFALSGDMIRLYDYKIGRSIHTIETFIPDILSKTRDFSSQTVLDIAKLEQQITQLEQLEMTGIYLAMIGYNVPQSDRAFLEGFKWNFYDEEGRIRTETMYPNTTFYLSDTYDSTARAKDLIPLALSTLLNRRHGTLLENCVNASYTLTTRLFRENIDTYQRRLWNIFRIFSAAEACCGVLLAVAVVYCITLMRRALSIDTAGMSQMHQQLFSKHAYLCKVTLIAVAVCLTVAFGHGMYAVQSVSAAALDLDSSSARMWLVSMTEFYAQRKAQGDREANAALIRLVPKLVASRDVLYTKSLFTMSDTKHTDILFGGSNPSGVSAKCDRSTIPVETKFNQWIWSVIGMIDGGAMPSDMYNRAEDLLRGLASSNDELASVWRSSVSQNMTIQLILLCVTLAVLVGVYVVIFRPMIQQLIVEEEGTKMMLRMIPQHVQESVPEIADYLQSDSMDTDELLKRNLKQSEKLLQNILPPAISRRLKLGEAVISDYHERITSTMTDFVGFADFARGKSAGEIVEFLNEIFCLFDTVCDAFHIEKIKTIQQIYFFVSGLSVQSKADHALRALEAALQFYDLVAEHFQRHGVDPKKLMLRVGMHSGSAVAGVIGSRKICYDLWGDTINTSSRVQYNGIQGRIQVTDETYKDVSDYFIGVPREIVAKGKGTIHTYVITGRLKPSSFTTTGKKSKRIM